MLHKIASTHATVIIRTVLELSTCVYWVNISYYYEDRKVVGDRGKWRAVRGWLSASQ